MTEQEIKIVVHQINDYLSEQLWMDFEIAEYSKYVMRISGCLDFSGQPNLEIILHDVFFASAVFAWTTDTARQAVELIEGEEARQINMKFHVEQGYHLIRFQAEDYPDTCGCIFGVKEMVLELPRVAREIKSQE